MFKKISFAVLLVSIMLLSACHPCDERDLSDEGLAAYAAEYEFEDYIVEYSSWDDIEAIGEHITGERCSVIPEHTGRQLVDNTGDALRILYVSACEEDDVYLYEADFPSFQHIEEELDRYNNIASISIDELDDSLDTWQARFQFMSRYTGIDRDYPIGYYVGTMTIVEDEIEVVKDVWVIQITETSFGFARLIYQDDGYLFLVFNSFELE